MFLAVSVLALGARASNLACRYLPLTAMAKLVGVCFEWVTILKRTMGVNRPARRFEKDDQWVSIKMASIDSAFFEDSLIISIPVFTRRSFVKLPTFFFGLLPNALHIELRRKILLF